VLRNTVTSAILAYIPFLSSTENYLQGDNGGTYDPACFEISILLSQSQSSSFLAILLGVKLVLIVSSSSFLAPMPNMNPPTDFIYHLFQLIFTFKLIYSGFLVFEMPVKIWNILVGNFLNNPINLFLPVYHNLVRIWLYLFELYWIFFLSLYLWICASLKVLACF
jgi:hypothetical protein